MHHSPYISETPVLIRQLTIARIRKLRLQGRGYKKLSEFGLYFKDGSQ